MLGGLLVYEYQLAAAQLILAMVGMGATLRPQDFVAEMRAPRPLVFGLLTQTFVVPALAFVLNALLAPPAGIAVGLALISAVPGGSMSNVCTYLAGGNVVLSIGLTAISTLGALVTTPLILGALATEHLATEVAMPVGRIVFEIAVCLLGPLAVGMMLGSALPQYRQSIATWCVRGSVAVIVVFAVASAAAERIDVLAYGAGAPVLMIVFAATAQAAALSGSRVLGLSRRDAVAIGIEVTVRNANLALLVKAAMFPAVVGIADPVADGVFFVALLYGGVALLAVAPLCVVNYRRAQRGNA